MTLIHLTVRFTDSTLDVRLLRVSDSTICIGVARVGGGGVGLRAYPPRPCGQLMHCFSAVAELLDFRLQISEVSGPIVTKLCHMFDGDCSL